MIDGLTLICHGDCEGVPIADLVTSQRHEAVGEASALGFAPGVWPPEVRIEGVRFLRNGTRTGGSYEYRAISGPMLTLLILND